MEVKEEGGICMESPEGKPCRTGFRSKGCGGECSYISDGLEAMAYSPRNLAIQLRQLIIDIREKRVEVV